MTVKSLTTQKTKELNATRQEISNKHKGKPANVLTPPEKDEIMLTMAEALGFYDPTP